MERCQLLIYRHLQRYCHWQTSYSIESLHKSKASLLNYNVGERLSFSESDQASKTDVRELGNFFSCQTTAFLAGYRRVAVKGWKVIFDTIIQC